MRVLVLGGTVFLGRHVVEALLARGHDVMLFHRGERGRALFLQVERVLGDRATDLDRLPADATWHAVVDTSGYVPGIVRTSATALAVRAARYVFVSSISVYDVSVARIDESTPTPELPAEASRAVMIPETYGPLKLECEREVLAAFGEAAALIVRPGLIVGPHDPTDRFTYWPVRFARGGAVAVPADLDGPAQWLDVRDLAVFIVDALEREQHGVVNTAGPGEPATQRDLYAACAAAAGGTCAIVPVPLEVLREHQVGEWIDMPMWSAPNGGHDGLLRVDPARAIALGMRYRPLPQTAADTLRWARSERGDEPFRAGLTPEREAPLLAAAAATPRSV